jgi:cytochrome P450
LGAIGIVTLKPYISICNPIISQLKWIFEVLKKMSKHSNPGCKNQQGLIDMSSTSKMPIFPVPSRTAAQRPGLVNLLRSLPELRVNPIKFMQDSVDRYGDMVHFKLGRMNAYLINHPRYIQHVLQEKHQKYSKDTIQYRALSAVTGNGLLTSDGEEWLQHRRLIQPVFHRQRIEGFGSLMTATTEKMLFGWGEKARSGQAVDIDQAMMILALEILGKALLGIDLSGGAPELTHAVLTVLDHIVGQVKSPPGIPGFIPTPANRRFKAAMRTLDRVVTEIVQNHLDQQDSAAGDLLSRLIQTGAEGGHPVMGARQLRDEVITFLIAGHETVASALTWACYLLSQNPQIEQRMRLEIDSVLNGRTPSVEDLPALDFTRRVFDETLRMYPPAWLITRKCIEEDEIGGCRIPRGALVVIGVSAIHRHPDFWPDPDRFDPDRFSNEGSINRHHFAYLPFGGGPRLCIGKSFALAEAPLILAMIFQRYRLELDSNVPVEAMALVTQRPRGGLPMKITHVEKSPA